MLRWPFFSLWKLLILSIYLSYYLSILVSIYLLPVNVPGAEGWEVAELRRKLGLYGTSVREFDRLIKLVLIIYLNQSIN